MIERWLMVIRDHPQRPSAQQCHVLTMLALRLDWKTGTGYASTAQLMADTDTSRATVKRATSWARRSQLLLQTRRGHRLGNGETAASEWRLTRPVDNPITQGLTPEPLTSQGLNGHVSRAQQDNLKGSAQTPHQESSSSRTSPSARGAANGAARARPKPPWCGECHEQTRLTDDDHPRRCPVCHPLAGGLR